MRPAGRSLPRSVLGIFRGRCVELIRPACFITIVAALFLCDWLLSCYLLCINEHTDSSIPVSSFFSVIARDFST